MKEDNSNYQQQTNRQLVKQNDEKVIQNNQKQEIGDILFRLRLKVAAKMMVNSTNSKMYENLQPIQIYLINDKASNNNYTNPDNLQTKNLNLIAQEESQNIVKIQNNKKKGRLAKIMQDFSFPISQIMKYLIQLFFKIPVISPSSMFKYIWDFFHMNLILIYLFLIPIHISFGIPFSILISKEIADLAPISFIIDTLINLNTGYYDKGIAVKNKWKIFKNYFKNNIISDILAVIPNIIYHYSIVQDQDYDPEAQISITADFTYIIKFFLLFFFMKLSSFNEIIKKLEERLHINKRMSNIIQFLKLLFTIVIIAHIFACLWVFIANIETNHQMQTWMDYLEISQANWKIKYIRAYYFSVVTMITVGYGDILPKTDYEMILSVASIMISCGVYAYLFNEVGSLFNEFSKNSKLMKHNMQLINLYMHEKSINSHLQYQVRDYLEYFWKEQMDRDEEGEMSIINQLSDELRQKLLIEANKIVLKDSPIFANNFSDRVIQKTISLIKEQRILPEQIIVQEGSIENNSIFFIEKGCVEIIITNQNTQDGVLTIKTLTKGQCFEADTFFTGSAHKLTIRSKEFTTLLFICREDFLNLLKDFPEDYEHFCVLKDQIVLNSQYQLLGMQCQSCGSFKHTSLECQYLHYQPIIRSIIKKFNKKNNNDKRQDYERQFPLQKSRTLTNLQDIQEAANEYAEENEELLNDLNLMINQQNKLLFYSMQSEQETHDNDVESQLDAIKEVDEQFISTPEKGKNDILKDQPKNQEEIKVNDEKQEPSNPALQKEENSGQQQQQQQQTQNDAQKTRSLFSSVKNKVIQSNKQLNKNSNQQQQKKQVKDISRIFRKRRSTLKKNSIKLPNQIQQKMQENQFSQKLIDFLNIKFKILQDKIGNSNQNDQKDQIDNKKNVDIIEQNFDCMKNFAIYFPFNNLDYQLKLIQLPLQQKKFFTQRIIIDNLIHYKKLIANKETSYNKQNDTMNKLLQKFQKEKEQEQDQQRMQFDLLTIQPQKKKQQQQQQIKQQSIQKRVQQSQDLRNSVQQLSFMNSPMSQDNNQIQSLNSQQLPQNILKELELNQQNNNLNNQIILLQSDQTKKRGEENLQDSQSLIDLEKYKQFKEFNFIKSNNRFSQDEFL